MDKSHQPMWPWVCQQARTEAWRWPRTYVLGQRVCSVDVYSSEAYLIAGLVPNRDTRDLSLHERFCLQLTILVIYFKKRLINSEHQLVKKIEFISSPGQAEWEDMVPEDWEEPSSLAYSLKVAAGFWGSVLTWRFHLPEFLHASVTMTTSLKSK